MQVLRFGMVREMFLMEKNQKKQLHRSVENKDSTIFLHGTDRITISLQFGCNTLTILGLQAFSDTNKKRDRLQLEAFLFLCEAAYNQGYALCQLNVPLEEIAFPENWAIGWEDKGNLVVEKNLKSYE